MPIGQIQIHQQRAMIGMETQPPVQRIEQPQATIDMRQIPPKLDIQQPQGILEINQDRAWDALGLANNLEVTRRINSRGRDIALQGIARRMQEGRQLADLAHIKSNPIPQIAKGWRKEGTPLPVAGPASMGNVDIRYTAQKPIINVEQGGVDLRVQPNRPIHEYTPGKVNIYMQQYAEVRITPPSIDTLM